MNMKIIVVLFSTLSLFNTVKSTTAPTTTTEILPATTTKGIGQDIRLHNNCPYTIWPGILGDNGKGQPENGGFELGVRQTKVISLENFWSGRIWGRTGCDDSGHCETGDCGNKIECNGTDGVGPVSLAKITLSGAGRVNLYRIDQVNGFNIPMKIVATDGYQRMKNHRKNYCGEAGCAFDLNTRCPKELAVKIGDRTVACNSACKQFNTIEYCCLRQYNSYQTCNSTIWPINYPAIFERDCPNAYNYPFDVKSAFYCLGDPLINYEITFCPSVPLFRSVNNKKISKL